LGALWFSLMLPKLRPILKEQFAKIVPST